MNPDEFVAVSAKNAEFIRTKLEALSRIDTTNADNSGSFRMLADEAAELLRSLRPLDAPDRESLNLMYREIWEKKKQGDDAQRDASKRYAAAIGNALNEIEALGIPKDKAAVDAFQAKFKAALELFKTLKPLYKDDREPLSKRVDDIREASRQHIDAYYNARTAASAANKRALLEIFSKVTALLARETVDNALLAQAETYHTEASENLKTVDLSREDRDECWDKWRQTKDILLQKRQTLKQQNYANLVRAIDALEGTLMLGNPRDAFDSLKALQLQKRTLTLTPEHIADLNTRFDEAFSNLKTRQNDQWKSEMGTRVKNLERAIEKDAEFITRLEEQIEDLKNKMVEAHSEIYRTKIGGWITEKENKIREVETHKAELEAKTRDIKEKSGTPTVDSPPATDPT